MSIYRTGVISVAIATLLGTSAHAYNLRQFKSTDGLSNSAVMSIIQDEKRFLWIGTYDGLNVYNGQEIRSYKPSIDNSTSLTSNVIREIHPGERGYLWLTTKWGLNKYNILENCVEEKYDEFNEECHFASDDAANLIILGHNGFLSYYLNSSHKFINLPIDPDISKDDVNGLELMNDGLVWLLHKGTVKRYRLDCRSGSNPTAEITPLEPIDLSLKVGYVFKSGQRIILIDEAGNLYDATGEYPSLLTNIQDILSKNGSLTSLLLDGDDILLGLRDNGVIRLVNNESGYRQEAIRIDCGVFTLWKDEAQDIIWIGTDGQGVFQMTKDEYSFNGISLNDISNDRLRSARSLYEGKRQDLWIGTKGNGVFRILDYREPKLEKTKISHFTTEDGLANNSVFRIVSSDDDIIWLGVDGPGINYYDYADGRIHSLINDTGVTIRYIHSLLVEKDSLLWVGAGNELLRVPISRTSKGFKAESIDRFSFNVKNKHRFNQIYDLCHENDTSLWVGMRGNGIIRFNTRTLHSTYYTFDSNGIAPMNDVLCLYFSRDSTLWIGTSYGLIGFDPKTSEYKAYNENDGLPNNTIHGITEDRMNRLWLSSNAGLILFNVENGTFHTFNDKSGIKEYEYNDNASFQKEAGSTSLFGGLNGVVWIDAVGETANSYTPPILFTGLKIFNTQYNITGRSITLDHSQNQFSIKFVAMDYMNADNGMYSYKMEGLSDMWIQQSTGEAHFTNLKAGNYILRVRFTGGISDITSEDSIAIKVLAPWYASILARIIYILMAIAAAVIAGLLIRRRNNIRKELTDKQIKEKYKEEMYESKLRFFTNITHEFCTPISLIYGPCERILDSKESTSGIRQYASLIKANTERLNLLIQEIIDFGRVESGSVPEHITRVKVGQELNALLESFMVIATRNNISLNTSFDESLIWNTDRRCFHKIISNILSNAFKYTPLNGRINVIMDTYGNNLRFRVSNSGKGIPESELKNIFSRYKVLDNITENSISGLSARNGLGLSVVHTIVEQLGGKIDVESINDAQTTFTITLPEREAAETEEPDKPAPSVSQTEPAPAAPQSEQSILIIDDNKDMRWLLQDIFEQRYNVLLAENAEQGIELLKENSPSLIITDIIMPGIDGLSLVKTIRKDPHMTKIPIIVLSAKNTDSDRLEAVSSGADQYITKPFDISYITAAVDNLIKKSRSIESYYSSSASSVDFLSGTLTNKEDITFAKNAARKIAENISDNTFTAERLAESLQMSVRNLYRRFEALGLPSPKTHINDERVKYASKLLITTSLTLEEVMYRCGFVSRSHFNKVFSERTGCSPREYRNSNRPE